MANERIIEEIEKSGKTQAFIAKELGFAPQNFNRMLKNDDIKLSVLRNIADILSIPITQLISSKPIGIKNDINETNTRISYPLITEIEAFAGITGNAEYSIDLDSIEERYVIPLFNNKGVDFLIQVRGSSMYPKYSSGDIVACRFVREILYIQWNKVYILDTKSQGCMIKRLKKSDIPNKVICKSDNKDYDDFEVPFTDIQNLAIVIGVIRLE